MSIDKKNVEHIAELARLRLTEEEKELYSGQLDAILSWVDQLNEVDARGAGPAPAGRAGNALAGDNPETFADRDAVIKNFTSREGDFLKVKKAIER